MAEKLGIIADDLTGVCDAGVGFAARGFSRRCRSTIAARILLDAGWDGVLALNAETSSELDLSAIRDGLPVITRSGSFGRPYLFHSLMRSFSGAEIQ